MRIAIIGSPGSGKSTLAFELQKLTGLPLYHLDQYYWKPGWVRPEKEAFEKMHHSLCDQEEWIIEGMATRHFDYRAKKADLIIFLDAPLWVCLYRIFKRAIAHYGQVRNASAVGCPERFPDWEFLSYVWNFNRKYRPTVEAAIESHKKSKKIFIVRSDAEFNRLIRFISRIGKQMKSQRLLRAKRMMQKLKNTKW